jgi:hypothetical protein
LNARGGEARETPSQSFTWQVVDIDLEIGLVSASPEVEMPTAPLSCSIIILKSSVLVLCELNKPIPAYQYGGPMSAEPNQF